jgi:hypothetical protein
MVLNALVKRLKHRSKDDLKGRHFEAMLILRRDVAETRRSLAPPLLPCVFQRILHRTPKRVISMACTVQNTCAKLVRMAEADLSRCDIAGLGTLPWFKA